MNMAKRFSRFLIVLAACSATPALAGEVIPYPFNFCIVSGEELDPYAEPYAAVYEGRQFRFCCKDCWAEFRADPRPYRDKLLALLEKQQAAAKNASEATATEQAENERSSFDHEAGAE